MLLPNIKKMEGMAGGERLKTAETVVFCRATEEEVMKL